MGINLELGAWKVWGKLNPIMARFDYLKRAVLSITRFYFQLDRRVSCSSQQLQELSRLYLLIVLCGSMTAQMGSLAPRQFTSL